MHPFRFLILIHWNLNRGMRNYKPLKITYTGQKSFFNAKNRNELTTTAPLKIAHYFMFF